MGQPIAPRYPCALPGVNLADYSRTAADRGWGPGWPTCAGARNNLKIVTADRSGVRVSVHARIARLVDMLLDETERRGYLFKAGQTGAYNCRAIGGTNSPSNHSWALAIDINWQDNPFTVDITKNNMPPWVVQLWARYGFAWGGWYTGRKDLMHTEAMFTPEQADQLTDLAARELTGVTTGADEMTPDQSRKLDEIHHALCFAEKPWKGGISDIEVNSDADVERARPYTAGEYRLRNNVEIYRTHADVRVLASRVNDLYVLVSSLAGQLNPPAPAPATSRTTRRSTG